MIESNAAIHQDIDEQYVPPLHVRDGPVYDAAKRLRTGRRIPRLHFGEVADHWAGQLSNQIGEKDKSALQNADCVERLGAVVPGNLFRHSLDPFADFLLRKYRFQVCHLSGCFPRTISPPEPSRLEQNPPMVPISWSKLFRRRPPAPASDAFAQQKSFFFGTIPSAFCVSYDRSVYIGRPAASFVSLVEFRRASGPIAPSHLHYNAHHSR